MLCFGVLTSFPLTSLPATGNTIIVSLTEAATATDTDSVLATMNVSLTESLIALDTDDVFHNKVDWSPRPLIRDWWDRDEWGNFIRGGGTHRG